MRGLQRRILIHNDIHLNIVVLPRMIRAARIHLLDAVVVRHDQVNQLADEVLRRRLAHQQPDVIESVRGPRNED